MDTSIPIEEDDMPPLVDENGEGAGPSKMETSKLPNEESEMKLVQRKRKPKKSVSEQEPMDTLQPRPKRKKDSGDVRKIPVPSNRYSPLKEQWMKLFAPVVEHLNLQIRYNLKTRCVELRATKNTDDLNNLQKGADFISAFILGFSVEDALALVRLDELFLESFEINDVKPLKGEHLSRAIGRIAGKDGRTKFTIENITKTRIVLADSKIHLLGSFQNIKVARNAICNLILGSPPSKVYGNLRRVASRAVESF